MKETINTRSMRVYFGKNRLRETVSIELEEAGIRFILLAGRKGAGKGFFTDTANRDLIREREPKDIGFIFFDMTGEESREWIHSPYLLGPVVTDPEEGILMLERMAEESARRSVFIGDVKPIIVIHIQGDAMVRLNRERVEQAIAKIRKGKEKNNIYLFYATSRIDKSYLGKWLKEYVDLRIVFKLSNRDDARFLVDGTDPLRFTEPGEHILYRDGRSIRCFPLQSDTRPL